MAFNIDNIRAVVFDYGNTLIRFGRAELEAYDAILADGLVERYGPLDYDKFHSYRMASRMAPYEGDPPAYRENDFSSITSELIEAIYGITPSAEDLDELLKLRLDAFIKVVSVEPHVHEVLEALKRRFALGLLSNYPDGNAIRVSLDRCGLTSYFQSIVVSGDVGFVKPHPDIFSVSLSELGVRAEEVLFVGDNWLADVQGAKRNGLHMVRMNRWMPPEHFEASPEDHRPDVEISHLEELMTLLSVKIA